MENFLNVLNDDNEELNEYPALARLIELGRQKSYVTIDDILHFFPDAEQEVDQLEEAFAALMSAGIPYVEDETPLDGPSEDDLDTDVDEKELDEEDESAKLVLDDLENIDTDEIGRASCRERV